MLTGVFIYWGWESAVNLTEETEDSVSAPGVAGVTSTVILLVTYISVTVAVVAYAGPATARGVRRRRGDLLDAGRRRARLAARQAGRAGDPDLGAGLDPDDDPAGLADDPLDGPCRRDASGARQGPPALLHAARLDDHDRRGGDRLVRRRQRLQRELPLRHADRARADDRLLLRADRRRLRHLLPPRADEVGDQLPLHRRRAAGRRADARLPVRQGDDRLRRPGRVLHRLEPARHRAADRDRSRLPAARIGADAALAGQAAIPTTSAAGRSRRSRPRWRPARSRSRRRPVRRARGGPSDGA